MVNGGSPPACDADGRSHRKSRVAPGLWGGWGVLATLSAAGPLGDRWWGLELVSHFRVQYMAAALLLSLVAVCVRQWRVAAGLAVLAFVLAGTMLPLWWPSPAVAVSDGRLRLLMANLHAANDRAATVLDMIDREQADVVILLEYTGRWQADLQVLESTYAHTRQEPREDNFGIALFSRVPWIRVDVLALGTAGPPCVCCDMQLDNAIATLLGVHVYPPVSREASHLRDQQLEQIARLARDVPHACVVAGDLNCTSWSPRFETLLATSGLRDTRAGWGLQATWPTWMIPLMIPIDHCLITPDLAVSDRHLTRPLGSDHLGVVIDLQRGGP